MEFFPALKYAAWAVLTIIGILLLIWGGLWGRYGLHRLSSKRWATRMSNARRNAPEVGAEEEPLQPDDIAIGV